MRDRRTPPDELLTTAQAARMLNFSLRTIYRRIKAKTIPHSKIGREYRFARTDLEAWIAEQPGVPPTGSRQRRTPQ